jgi:hypothetical protein
VQQWLTRDWLLILPSTYRHVKDSPSPEVVCPPGICEVKLSSHGREISFVIGKELPPAEECLVLYCEAYAFKESIHGFRVEEHCGNDSPSKLEFHSSFTRSPDCMSRISQSRDLV